MAERYFSLAEARALMPEVLAVGHALVPVRAELAERSARLRDGDRSQLADVKGLEARLSDLLDGLVRQGIQIKGYAPLLVDFPMRHGDRILLLCWLENEPELAWYHDAELGFLGRRPLAELDEGRA
jgi:hypothetical protein